MGTPKIDDPYEKRSASLEQVSAGGVAYRQSGDKTEIAIVSILPEMRWQLPKGMIDPGETKEQAASREVREEAGVETKLIKWIADTEYWFHAVNQGVRRRFHKQVHWYLMKYVSGSVDDHDHEVAESKWVSIEDALQLLVFKNERDVVMKASELIGAYQTD